jgi:hypothetical protein
MSDKMGRDARELIGCCAEAAKACGNVRLEMKASLIASKYESAHQEAKYGPQALGNIFDMYTDTVL